MRVLDRPTGVASSGITLIYLWLLETFDNGSVQDGEPLGTPSHHLCSLPTRHDQHERTRLRSWRPKLHCRGVRYRADLHYTPKGLVQTSTRRHRRSSSDQDMQLQQ